MKQFKVTWYQGSIEKVVTVLKTEVMKGKDIDHVNFVKLLPKKEPFDKYFKVVLWSDSKHTIDYGSWSRFILIEEVKNTSELVGDML